MKNRPARSDGDVLHDTATATIDADRPFAENLDNHLRFQHDSVITNAPETSGVYGLFSALWVYIGEADNIRDRLLKHLDGDLPCLRRYWPSGFAFELVSPAARHLRHEYLIDKYQPYCQCSRRKS
jgi:hypothetical protein